MKTKRVLFSVLLAGLVMFGFTACNDDDDNNGDKDRTSSSSKTSQIKEGLMSFEFLLNNYTSKISPDALKQTMDDYGWVLYADTLKQQGERVMVYINRALQSNVDTLNNSFYACMFDNGKLVYSAFLINREDYAAVMSYYKTFSADMHSSVKNFTQYTAEFTGLFAEDTTVTTYEQCVATAQERHTDTFLGDGYNGVTQKYVTPDYTVELTNGPSNLIYNISRYGCLNNITDGQVTSYQSIFVGVIIDATNSTK